MALRAAYNSIGGRQRNPALLSIPRYLQRKPHLHHSPPQRFTLLPIHQPGEWSVFPYIYVYTNSYNFIN